ncbi:MAG: hypothetical protein JNM86_09125 [Phycisphaerae bacterium]|nr:hypothetical protein [Phycisphaerae bacterium]
MKVSLIIRQLSGALPPSPVSLSWSMPDEPLLFAGRIMQPIEIHDGFVVASRVHVATDITDAQVANAEVVIDPDKGASATSLMAAIERATGAETTAIEAGAFSHANTDLNASTYYSMGLWRRRLDPGGDIPPKPPAGPHCVAFYAEMALPPAFTYGVMDRGRVIETLSGRLTRIGMVFPETDYCLHKAIENRKMNIFSRIGWAFGAVGGNIHDLTIQLLTLPSGRQRWVGEGVVCFGTAMQVHAARGLLYSLSAIYGLYPKAPNSSDDPFDPKNVPMGRFDDPFEDLRRPGDVY